ncbi:ribose-phosphate pyrophosphokinase 4-like isoform X1 [Olea europaea subsp. europaea]|uniref:Ribose-phosphate pyrophosphokinase 4-like isoform X1 n=1 Tax=Olea europaea subsp. europaea TaxID=158383 RepID=A0A8S0RS94_OLEEU|nr:ribose-phosphate pyrophosphokinase 4-like isoform X1 [Olea europaea subsp. europaea]
MSAVSPSPSILLTSTKPSNETHKTIIIPFIKKPTIPTIQCEFRSFENNSSSYQNLIADSSNRIHIIFKPPSSSPLTTASSMDLSIKHSKRVCLFYCSEMKDLAERIASASDSIELRGITWRTFEDGFPNLFISNAHGIRGQRVAFLASFSSPGVIFEQLSIIYALPKLFVSSFTLVLPFFPTGTFERMEEEGDVATAFTLARILSNIPISRGGPTSLERFYFGDNILPCFESGIPLLLNRLQKLPDSDNIAIAFPDDGAWKRFHKQLQHFPTIVCIKVREGDQRIVRLKEGDPKGRHVVIVDDLVQSGGTLLECQVRADGVLQSGFSKIIWTFADILRSLRDFSRKEKVLANHGATKISAYVTHGIFPNSTWERFKHDAGGNPENGMTYFWITDSCPRTVKQVENKSPFEILSLAAPIAAALQV